MRYNQARNGAAVDLPIPPHAQRSRGSVLKLNASAAANAYTCDSCKAPSVPELHGPAPLCNECRSATLATESAWLDSDGIGEALTVLATVLAVGLVSAVGVWLWGAF